MEGWFEVGTWFQSPSSSRKHEKQDVASTDWVELTNMRLVPPALELCKGHKIWGLASDTARP
jgi:hypothetical protein